MNSTDTKVIEDLIETLEDGREGFSRAAEKLREDGRADLAGTMQRFATQREELASELQALAPDAGNGNGTAAGALHRGWLQLKDALTGDDPHAVLAAAERGEDHAVSEYEKALEKDLDPSTRTVVERQARQVREAHDTVKALRDSTG